MRSWSVRALPSTEISPTRISTRVIWDESGNGTGISPTVSPTAPGKTAAAVSRENCTGTVARPGAWAAAERANGKTASSALSARSAGLGKRRRRGRGDRIERELVVPAKHEDLSSGGELATKDEFRERILEVFLDGALERSGPERRIEPLLDEQLDGFWRELEIDLLGAESSFDLTQKDLDDFSH